MPRISYNIFSALETWKLLVFPIIRRCFCPRPKIWREHVCRFIVEFLFIIFSPFSANDVYNRKKWNVFRASVDSKLDIFSIRVSTFIAFCFTVFNFKNCFFAKKSVDSVTHTTLSRFLWKCLHTCINFETVRNSVENESVSQTFYSNLRFWVLVLYLK